MEEVSIIGLDLAKNVFQAHGLPLKRFGNWRTKFRHEDPRLTGKLLWRCGGGTDTSASTSTKDSPRATWITKPGSAVT